ncbi:hypothetical protein TNCV_291331 [Trichonephila clavipes]|nr:hypothetical protein TNCV_291331 [Trichonephila clavipes]
MKRSCQAYQMTSGVVVIQFMPPSQYGECDPRLVTEKDRAQVLRKALVVSSSGKEDGHSPVMDSRFECKAAHPFFYMLGS